MSDMTVTSFGHRHAPAPEADLVVDVRGFRDPHLDPALRELTAADPAVVAAVMATPGVAALIESVAAEAAALPVPSSVAVGCAGGRHRAPVIAEAVARRLASEGIRVTVKHRDITRPVLRSTR